MEANEHEGDSTVGICLSGGGVRSSAFSLGAIQALQEELGLLKGDDHARFLSAVSGGSYTAAAFMLSAGGVLETPSMPPVKTIIPEQESPDGHPLPRHGPKDGVLSAKDFDKMVDNLRRDRWVSFSPANPLMPGTDEANFLRQHARYFTEPTGVGNLWTFFWLTVANQGLILSIVVMFGLTFGGIWRAMREFLSIQQLPEAAFGMSVMIQDLAAWVLTSIAVFIFGLVNARKVTRRTYARFRSAADMRFEGAVYVLTLTVTLAVGGIFIPSWLTDLFYATRDGVSLRWLGPIAVALLGAATTAAPLIAVLGAATKGGVPKAVAGRSARAARGIGRVIFRLLQALVGLVVPCLFIVTFYGAWAMAANTRTSWGLILSVVLFIVYWHLLAIFTGGAHQFSPFLLYRRCLSNCFDVVRQYRSMEALPDGTAPTSGAHRARQRNINPLMSRLRALSDVPELLICASVNLSEVGATAAGAHARQLVFSPYTIEIAGIPDAKLRTMSVEDAIVNKRTSRDFDGSVLSCVAVTGAAVSPMMGKFTRSWLRALLCFLNLRLGVWILNPASKEVQDALLPVPEDEQERIVEAHQEPTAQALQEPSAEVGQEPAAQALMEPESEAQQQPVAEAESANEADAEPRKGIRLKPRTGYGLLARELRGKHYLQSRYIYASDRGHYENLGLVELLRRRCTEVWCIDASGDPPGSALTLAQSLTVLSAEYGYNIDFDMSVFELASSPAEFSDPLMRSTYGRGTLTLRTNDRTRTCTVHVVKIGMDSCTSRRFHMMRTRYRDFPYDSTFNQLYDAERFDLYRDLGYESTLRAIGTRLEGSGAGRERRSP